MTKQAQFSNAHSGALFGNGGDLLGILTAGEWKDGAERKHRLVLGADTDGVRSIATVSADGQTVKSTGTVRRERSRNPKAPHYRGKLGSVDIVLFHVDGAEPYYQVRTDKGRPAKAQVGNDVLAFLGGESASKPTCEVKQNGPF